MSRQDGNDPRVPHTLLRGAWNMSSAKVTRVSPGALIAGGHSPCYPEAPGNTPARHSLRCRISRTADPGSRGQGVRSLRFGSIARPPGMLVRGAGQAVCPRPVLRSRSR